MNTAKFNSSGSKRLPEPLKQIDVVSNERQLKSAITQPLIGSWMDDLSQEAFKPIPEALLHNRRIENKVTKFSNSHLTIIDIIA